ncbi:MAG: glutamate-5-semialdehyde dehydrogenase [Candidatus Eremiobacterota bacterium]
MLKVSPLRQQALRARAVSRQLAGLSTAHKDGALAAMAGLLRQRGEAILQANRSDLEAAERQSTATALLDRLRLTPQRVESMARGVEEVRSLPDPVGQEKGWRRPNGLQIRKVRVPLGVLAIIYEARPNVTVEASTLAFKSGNACLLRGSSSARHSNRILVEVLQDGLEQVGLPREAIQAVDDGRDTVDELATLQGLVDCVIPRGGHELIQRVVRVATVPVIETGVGNCHVYVERSADLDQACAIVVNAKTSRPAVCNAAETLLVDRTVAGEFLPRAAAALAEKGVELRGCSRTRNLVPTASAASDEDWDAEYLDLILAVRVVEGIDEALEHIARHGTGHSEAIVTRSLLAARRFQQEVDACAVYCNASTRFTDGGEFGFGAEIGISTQKMHARGPLGLTELTTTKYLIDGDGQIRL